MTTVKAPRLFTVIVVVLLCQVQFVAWGGEPSAATAMPGMHGNSLTEHTSLPSIRPGSTTWVAA